MIAIEVNHPNLAGKSPISCPEHATSTSLELKVVGYVMEVETYYDSGNEATRRSSRTR